MKTILLRHQNTIDFTEIVHVMLRLNDSLKRSGVVMRKQIVLLVSRDPHYPIIDNILLL